MVKLGDLARKVVGGGTPSTKIAEYWDGDIPWTTSAAIDEKTLYLTTHQRCITQKGLEESSAQLIPKGSVLIGTRVGVGKTAVTTLDIAISQDLTALIPKPDVSAEYVALVLKSGPLAKWFDENKRGTTIKGVSRNDVLRLMIPLPTFREQQAIATMLWTLRQMEEADKKHIIALGDLFNSLLHHLVTGKVRVEHLDSGE
ncbi:MAG: restriction endonuclease subunit S [Candidatus Omnitrophica bacterium]|nr:restriction endonuclease subunit S [Candidatus Omnitrophota bacterium]